MYVYTHIKYLYICTHMCMHVCVYMYLSVYVHVFIHRHPHTFIQCLSSGDKVVVREVRLRRMTQVIEALKRG